MKRLNSREAFERLSTRSREKFERDLACYNQHCEMFRSINQTMWRVPVVAITVNGGLWYAYLEGKGHHEVHALLFLFGFLFNMACIVMITRLRFVIASYWVAINSFNTGGAVTAKGKYFQSPKAVSTTLNTVLALAALVNMIVAVRAVEWSRVITFMMSL